MNLNTMEIEKENYLTERWDCSTEIKFLESTLEEKIEENEELKEKVLYLEAEFATMQDNISARTRVLQELLSVLKLKCKFDFERSQNKF